MADAPGDRDGWLRAYARGLQRVAKEGHRGWLAELRKFTQNQNVRHADPKPSAAVDKSQGPMLYIAQQIVKRMGKMGYPSKIAVFFRTPEQQNKEFLEGDSKARAWRSPHQFYEAVDIVHKTLAWDAPTEYWKALGTCVRVIEAELGVVLTWGGQWGWDMAHVELKDWKKVRDKMVATHLGARVPTGEELDARWKQVLPSISQK